MAADVADALELDRVLWIPARQPPHKDPQSVSSADVRLAMVRAATRGDSRFEVSTLELDREGPSFMVDTVRAVRAESPDAELYLIIGADQVRAFATWREPEAIVEEVRLAVMARGGEAPLSGDDGPHVSAAVVVPVRRVDVSSTDVRSRLGAGGDIAGMVPEAVQAIIERDGLYSAP